MVRIAIRNDLLRRITAEGSGERMIVYLHVEADATNGHVGTLTVEGPEEVVNTHKLAVRSGRLLLSSTT
jgi:hypothetical protein